MEKKLNAGAFMELNSREAMEVDGGYKFIDDYTPTKTKTSSFATALQKTWNQVGNLINEKNRVTGNGPSW